jgi:toxin CptA
VSLQRSLQIRLEPSRRLTAALGLAHLGLALALLPLPWPAGWRVAGMAVVLAGAVPGIVMHARRRSRSAVVRLEVRPDGAIRLQHRDGRQSDGVVHGDSIVTPWLTVIGVTVPGRWRSTYVVVVPDAIDAEDFRRLRVRLRWPPSQGSDPADGANDGRTAL